MKRKYTLLAALLLISANLFGASSAFAHDEVVGVYPEAGSTVEAGIIDLSITFSEEVLTTDGTSGFEIAVTNEKGEKQDIGCLNPMGSSLSARTIAGEAGEYTVDWHSVSSDGHPAEGSFKFNVTGRAGEMISADALNACPRLLIAPAPEENPSAIAYSTDQDAVANDNTAIEIGILIFVVVVVIGSAVWVTTKRKRA
jgi:methionine-rich copper-binding protein CopC